MIVPKKKLNKLISKLKVSLIKKKIKMFQDMTSSKKTKIKLKM